MEITFVFYENKKLKSISEFKLDRHQRIGEGRFWEEKGYINNFICKNLRKPR